MFFFFFFFFNDTATTEIYTLSLHDALPFPSAHVAGSIVALISAWRFTRRAGYWLTPLVLSICVATVYGCYHYAMDVFAGVLMAVIGCWIGSHFCSAVGCGAEPSIK